MKVEELVRYAKSNLNVLLSGPHGVGKTSMIVEVARQTGLRLKYYSSATLDPWADLVGIPVPVGDDDNKHLKFIRPNDVDNAELVFFDELNRSHPKVQNAVLEMTQFKSINGVKLPHLRMVWAAINPAGNKYKVDTLDPALEDRFHIHGDIKANPQVEHFTRPNPSNPEEMLFTPEEAEHLVSWWNGLSKELRAELSPRRLEYFGLLIKEGIHPKYSVPLNLKITVPVGDLVTRFNGTKAGKWNMDQISAATEQKYQMYVSDRERALEISHEILGARVTYFVVNPALGNKILMLPKELRQKMYSNTSFRAKIQYKYKDTWANDCPQEIMDMIADSHTLGNALVNKVKNIDQIAIEAEKRVDALQDGVIKARKNLKNDVNADMAPPTLEEQERQKEKEAAVVA